MEKFAGEGDKKKDNTPPQSDSSPAPNNGSQKQDQKVKKKNENEKNETNLFDSENLTGMSIVTAASVMAFAGLGVYLATSNFASEHFTDLDRNRIFYRNLLLGGLTGLLVGLPLSYVLAYFSFFKSPDRFASSSQSGSEDGTDKNTQKSSDSGSRVQEAQKSKQKSRGGWELGFFNIPWGARYGFLAGFIPYSIIQAFKAFSDIDIESWPGVRRVYKNMSYLPVEIVNDLDSLRTQLINVYGEFRKNIIDQSESVVAKRGTSAITSFTDIWGKVSEVEKKLEELRNAVDLYRNASDLDTRMKSLKEVIDKVEEFKSKHPEFVKLVEKLEKSLRGSSPIANEIPISNNLGKALDIIKSIHDQVNNYNGVDVNRKAMIENYINGKYRELTSLVNGDNFLREVFDQVLKDLTPDKLFSKNFEVNASAEIEGLLTNLANSINSDDREAIKSDYDELKKLGAVQKNDILGSRLFSKVISQKSKDILINFINKVSILRQKMVIYNQTHDENKRKELLDEIKTGYQELSEIVNKNDLLKTVGKYVLDRLPADPQISHLMLDPYADAAKAKLFNSLTKLENAYSNFIKNSSDSNALTALRTAIDEVNNILSYNYKKTIEFNPDAAIQKVYNLDSNFVSWEDITKFKKDAELLKEKLSEFNNTIEEIKKAESGGKIEVRKVIANTRKLINLSSDINDLCGRLKPNPISVSIGIVERLDHIQDYVKGVGDSARNLDTSSTSSGGQLKIDQSGNLEIGENYPSKLETSSRISPQKANEMARERLATRTAMQEAWRASAESDFERPIPRNQPVITERSGTGKFMWGVGVPTAAGVLVQIFWEGARHWWSSGSDKEERK
jgi:hypothetical protein